MKGRQVERTNNAAVESNCSTSQLRILFWATIGARFFWLTTDCKWCFVGP
jgi:hypothetical protein